MKKILKKILILMAIVNFLGIVFELTTIRDNNIITSAPIQKDRLEAVKEKGVITVASPLMDISYFYLDPSTNKIAGIEADIITELAKRLGINKIETKNTAFSNLLINLNTDDNIDMASGGIFITPERENLASFTQPLYKSSDAVVVPTFSNIQFKDDLKNAVIGVEKGTVYENLAEKWKKDGLIKDIIIFENTPKLLDAINSQKVDAGLVDSVIVKYSLLKDKLPLRILQDYTAELDGNIAIAVRKDDTTLLKALNEKIDEIEADGTLYAILVQNGLDRSNMIEEK